MLTSQWCGRLHDLTTSRSTGTLSPKKRELSPSAGSSCIQPFPIIATGKWRTFPAQQAKTLHWNKR
jgi:hypothetical protein